MDYHKPVLLEEVIAHLKIQKGHKYIDATLGDAGHTVEILKLGGLVLGFDINESSLERAEKRVNKLPEELAKNFTCAKANFTKMEQIATEKGFDKVNGILFDLGYSSFQLEEGGIGLSFLRDEVLDMRLDKALGVTAADLVNNLPEQQLADIIFGYGGERMCKKFAHGIVERRSLKKLETTAELARLLVDLASPGYEHGRIHPATRTFQALRIAVNSEIDNLVESLPRAARLLLSGGRLIVISFHSLEDKEVKDFGRNARPYLTEITKKPVGPTEAESTDNPRARSAKMRVFEKK